MQEIQADPKVLAKLGVGKRRTARRWFLRGLAVIGLSAAGILFWRARIAEAKHEHWVTAPLEQGDLRETVTATGTLDPLDAVEIGAEVTGRVTQVHVDINDHVSKDQVLVELDTAPLQAQLEQAQAQLRSAQASYQSAQPTVTESEAKAKRTRELHAHGLVSDQDLETAEATLDRAKASVLTASAQINLAQANVKSAQTNKGKTIIRSPIDGIVLSRTVEPGQTVTSGLQTPVLFTLARDLTRMQLKIDVDEADVGKVREDQRATFVVDAYPKRQFSSQVVRLSNMPKSGTTVITYEAILTVDNSDRLLRPGMTATATIVTSEKTHVLTAPNAALRFQPPRASPAGSSSRPTTLPLPGMAGPGMRGGAGMGMGGGGRQRPSKPNSVTPGAPAASSESRSKTAVWIVKDNALKRIAVQVGASDGRRTEIQGVGLTGGTQVVIDVAEAEE